MKTFNQYITELAHLSAILTKKGDKLVNDLLSGNVTINFKIDTSAFVVANVSGELKFYGRQGAVELDKIKRAGSNIWEPFIKHIESRSWNKIPDGYKVYCEMFNDQIPTLVKYAVKPKNGLIISYCEYKGKVLRPDDPFCLKVAKILDISPPPVLHSGKLSSSQKNGLMDFLNHPEEHIGEDFTKFILSLFLPPAAMKYLVGKTMEGIVIYFADGSMAKVVDAGFTQAIKAKNGNTDEYYDAVSNLSYDHVKKAYNNIMKNKRSMKKIEAEKDAESKYIRVASAITGSIVNFIAKDMEQYDHLKQSVNKKRFSYVTKELIPLGMSSLINKYWWSEDVFRILLYALRKEKKRINIKTGLTTDRKNLINDIVADLKHKGLLE